MANGFPRISAMGMTGILVSFADTLSEPANRAALAFHARVMDTLSEQVDEIAVTLASVFLRFDPVQTQPEQVHPVLARLLEERDWYDAALPPGRKLWRIPTAYGGADGPQLEEVARLAGLSPEAAVAELSRARVRVLALGFAPCQPYLGTLDSHWDLPRQTDITPKVPQGALVVAVRQFVLFANASPTGWRQVGRSAFRCFDLGRDTPVALRPGDECQFVEATPDVIGAATHEDAQGYGNAQIEALP